MSNPQQAKLLALAETAMEFFRLVRQIEDTESRADRSELYDLLRQLAVQAAVASSKPIPAGTESRIVPL